jgi:hypothetical protein
MPPAEALVLLEREQTATPAEFARGLRNAFPEGLAGGPLRFRVSRDGVDLAIDLKPGPDRVIGGLRLPRLRVRLHFTAGDGAARARLLAHMDLAMHRGGG